ncbi:polyphosphate kinase 1, partial [bacterium]|nr:polyphosphate kinase 1 [bacterium]
MNFKLPKKYKLYNREISWLSFNARVLQEAENPDVPLLERLKFLGIFSSNLDEFFRVRVASLRRAVALKITLPHYEEKPEKVLNHIQEVVLVQQIRFEAIFKTLVEELEKERVFLINETGLTEEQGQFVKNYFRETVRPALVPIMLNQVDEIPELKGHAIYQAVTMSKKHRKHHDYAL